MCGIVYMQNFDGKPVNNDIMQQFDKQKHRGTQGFGLFDGSHLNMVRAAKEDQILKWLVKYDSDLIMFHHRNPTSTINVKKAAHPFATKKFFGDTQYVLVHNGMIYNSRELKNKHEEMGIKYQSVLDNGTFNDSEALLWDVALYLQGEQQSLEARGAIAFVCMKLKDGNLERLFFGRNNNPLKMAMNQHGISLSSEGKGTDIKRDVLYDFDYNTKKLKQKSLTIPTGYTVPSSTPYSSPSTGRWNDRSEYYPRTKGSPGDWLPERIRSKVRNFLPASTLPTSSPVVYYDEDGKAITEADIINQELQFEQYGESGYRRTGSGLFVPANTEDDVELEDTAHLNAPESTVEDKVFEYLLQSDGNFENAYWRIEMDYELIQEEDYKTVAMQKEARLLEQAMAYIEDDEEYLNEKSVSSMWRNVCQQETIYV